MRFKFKLLFFVILAGYALVLTTLPYVRVYYTYFTVPTLAFSALFGFGSLNNPRLIAAMVFTITLCNMDCYFA